MEIRRNFLNQRVVNQCNPLSQTAEKAKSLDNFKAEIDRFLIRKIKVYWENGVKWGKKDQLLLSG